MSESAGQTSLGSLYYEIEAKFDKLEQQLRDFESKIKTIKIRVEIDPTSLEQAARKVQSALGSVGRVSGFGGGGGPSGGSVVGGAVPGSAAAGGFPMIAAGGIGQNWAWGAQPAYMPLGSVIPERISMGGGGGWSPPIGLLPGGGGGGGPIPVTATRVAGSGGAIPPIWGGPWGGGGGGGAAGGGAMSRGMQRFLGPPNGMGLYMNLLFGGWEVAQSARAWANANIEAKYADTPLASLQAMDRGLQQMTAGPFGSIIGGVADILGVGPFQIHKTVASEEFKERMYTRGKELGWSAMASGGRAAAFNAGGPDMEYELRRVALDDAHRRKMDALEKERVNFKGKLEGELVTTPIYAGGGNTMTVVGETTKRVKRLSPDEETAVKNSLRQAERNIEAANAEYGAEMLNLTREKRAGGRQHELRRAGIVAGGMAAQARANGNFDEAERIEFQNEMAQKYEGLPWYERMLAMPSMMQEMAGFSKEQGIRRTQAAMVMQGGMMASRFSLNNQPLESRIAEMSASGQAEILGMPAPMRDQALQSLALKIQVARYQDQSNYAMEKMSVGGQLAAARAALGTNPYDRAPMYGDAIGMMTQAQLNMMGAMREGRPDLIDQYRQLGVTNLKLFQQNLLDASRAESVDITAAAGGGVETGRENIAQLTAKIGELISAIQNWIPKLAP